MKRTLTSVKGSGSHRLERVEKEIRDVVGTYLIVGLHGALPGMVSLTRVRLSADMKIASLNFTVMLTQNEGESVDAYTKRSIANRKESEKLLNARANDVQAELAHKLKMRYTPKCHFYYDEGFESALKVEQILRDMSVSAGRGDDLPATKFSDGEGPTDGSNSADDSDQENES